MDLMALQETIKAFSAERDLERFHTPKDLSTALMLKAAELMALFQWTTPEESRTAKTDRPLQVRIGEKLADVLLYLVQLADHAGVDLEQAVDDKLSKNANNYTLPDVQSGAVQQVPKPVQTHVLVDWENVQPKEKDIRDLVPDVTDVWIFHGPNQKRVGENQTSFGDALTLVPISRAGKNSLDFHLSYYVGYINSRNPTARFVVISNDQGYAPMLEHATELGFAASQVGFGVLRAVSKKVAAKKVPAKKPPVKTPVAKKVAPAKKSVQSTQKAGPVTPKKSIKSPAVKKAPKTASPASVGTAAKLPAAAKSAKTPVPAKKVAQSKTKATKSGATSMASASVAKPKHVTNSQSSVAVDEKAYAHVLASLQKTKNKPARKARLYGAVKSLLGTEKADDAAVERVVQRLTAEGLLHIEANGAVTKTP